VLALHWRPRQLWRCTCVPLIFLMPATSAKRPPPPLPPSQQRWPSSLFSLLRELFSALSSLDVALSSRVHALALGGAAEALVLLPAAAFSTRYIPLTLAAAAAALPRRVAADVLLGCLLTVAASSLLKAALRRPRPAAGATPRRRCDLRAAESNAAMPSGDAAQAAALAVALALATRAPAWLALAPATAFGRVYFGCHWLGDTIAGAALGATVAAAVHAAQGGAAAAAALGAGAWLAPA